MWCFQSLVFCHSGLRNPLLHATSWRGCLHRTTALHHRSVDLPTLNERDLRFDRFLGHPILAAESEVEGPSCGMDVEQHGLKWNGYIDSRTNTCELSWWIRVENIVKVFVDRSFWVQETSSGFENNLSISSCEDVMLLRRRSTEILLASEAKRSCQKHQIFVKQISWFFIVFLHFVPSKLFCSVGVACISFLQDLAQKIGKTFKAAKEAMSAVINMPPAESLWLLLFDQVPVHPTKPHLKPKRVQGWCESWVGIKMCLGEGEWSRV